MSRLREIVDDLGQQSREAYGSDFAAFRVYGATELLEWVKPKPPRMIGMCGGRASPLRRPQLNAGTLRGRNGQRCALGSQILTFSLKRDV